VARWDASVQHFGRTGVRMEQHARLYLCARCHAQVVLCSRCDRGNRYCGRACGRQARQEAQHAAAQRYQRSWRGRMAHAQRAQRWRQRRAGADAGCGAHKVTHQGSPAPGVAAPLAAWTPQSTCSELPATTVVSAPPSVDAAPCWRCRRCGAPQPPALRQGFVRHGLPLGRRHDPGP